MGHHYGYVSEQLINGWLFPHLTRAAPRTRIRRCPLLRQAIEGPRRGGDALALRLSGDRPDRHQQRGDDPDPRELLELYRAVPMYESVHRGQSTASRRMTERFEEAYDTIATWMNAPSRRTHRDLPQHHRGDQRGHVLDAHRVPRRRQRGHHEDGAQLQLRALVRADQGDPAAIRPLGGVSDGRGRPRAPESSTSTTWRGSSTTEPSWSAHRRFEFPRHQAVAAADPAIADLGGYAPAGGRLADTGGRCQLVPTHARRRAGAGRGLARLLLPQAAGAVRSRRPLCPGGNCWNGRCRSSTAATWSPRDR